MDQQACSGGSPSFSSQTRCRGRDLDARSGCPMQPTAPAGAVAAAMDEPQTTHRLTPRPRRSWDAAFLVENGAADGDGSGGDTYDTAQTSLPPPSRKTSISGASAGTVEDRAESKAGPGTAGLGFTAGAPDGDQRGAGGPARHGSRESGVPAGAGRALFSGQSASAGAATPAPLATATLPPDTRALPGVTSSSSASSSPFSPASKAGRGGGAVAGDEDLADSDEGVMARLVEFTEMARRAAVHNEELSRELSAEKRRVAHAARKLELSNVTCNELRESLVLAQDTVTGLREHEMAWAKSTASEMSLRAEICALKDEYSTVSGELSVLRKRCGVLQRENTELGDRLATIAEEKRQVESRARRLLRSDRYRGY